MRVLWLSHRNALGGAERSLIEATTALARRQHENLVVVPRPGPMSTQLLPGVRTAVIPFNPWLDQALGLTVRLRWWRYNLLKGVPAIRQLNRACQPDIVITNTLITPVAAFAARLEARPHAWFIREFGGTAWGQTFHLGQYLTMRIVGHISDAILLTSRALRDWIRPQLQPLPFFLVPPAVEIEVPRPQRGRAFLGEPRLLVVGDRTEAKGQRHAIRAVAALRELGTAATLTLVGRGTASYDAALMQLAERLGVEDHVRLKPFQGDVTSEYAHADIAVTCSMCEGFGRVTIEAMKMGCPVVGAAAGGTQELIQHEKTGLLYPPGSWVSLASQVRRLALDWALASQMAERAKAWANRNFNLSVYARRLERALGRAASGRRRFELRGLERRGHPGAPR